MAGEGREAGSEITEAEREYEEARSQEETEEGHRKSRTDRVEPTREIRAPEPQFDAARAVRERLLGGRRSDERSMGRLESWLAQWARCLCSICAMFAAAIATTLVVYYLSPAGSAKKNTMAAATVLIWIALGCLLWSLPPPETESVVNRRLFNRR